MEEKNIIIIGSGPAGYTAAIYAARANLKPIVFAGYSAGGQLMTTTDVENFPGFPEGIQGPDLMMSMQKQAERFGAEVHYKDVSKVDFSKKPFSVTVEDKTYTGKTVIISTGASARRLGLESETKFWAKGITSCATCDGAFYKGQEVAVTGGGDSAMEEANFLTRFASKVTIVNRRAELRASKIMQDRARANPKIEWQLNKQIKEITGGEKVTGLTLFDSTTKEETKLSVTGLFLAIGHIPNSSLFKEQIDLDDEGYIKATEKTETNIPGVFACGDVVDHTFRQAITAAGTGCRSAISAERYLESLGS